MEKEKSVGEKLGVGCLCPQEKDGVFYLKGSLEGGNEKGCWENADLS